LILEDKKKDELGSDRVCEDDSGSVNAAYSLPGLEETGEQIVEFDKGISRGEKGSLGALDTKRMGRGGRGKGETKRKLNSLSIRITCYLDGG
jgi:hypothetical protein